MHSSIIEAFRIHRAFSGKFHAWTVIFLSHQVCPQSENVWEMRHFCSSDSRFHLAKAQPRKKLINRTGENRRLSRSGFPKKKKVSSCAKKNNRPSHPLLGLSRQESYAEKLIISQSNRVFELGEIFPPLLLGSFLSANLCGNYGTIFGMTKKREILISGDDWKCIFYYCISPHYRTPVSIQDFKYSRPCFVYSFRHYLFSKPMVFFKKNHVWWCICISYYIASPGKKPPI